MLTLMGIAAAVAGPLYLAVLAGRIEVPELPDSAVVTADDGKADLSAWNATFVEKLLERGDDAIRGLCAGAAVLLLRPVLQLPQLGAGMVLERLRIGATVPLGADVMPPLWPLLLVLGLLVVAEAFRQGAQQHDRRAA